MSLYVIIYLILLLFSIFTYAIKKDIPLLYWICFIILTLFACFRFGEGADYFAYSFHYSMAPDFWTTPNSNIYLKVGHGELGYKYLMVLFKILGVEYKYFVSILSIIDMLLINRFIQKFCYYKVIALFLMFHTLYLTYVFSAYRQSIVICVFLGILFNLLLEKKYFQYCIGVTILCFFHIAAGVLILLPLVAKFSVEFLEICLTFSILLGMFFSVIFKYSDFQWFAIIERLVTLVFVIYMYSIYSKSNFNYEISIAIKCYIYGISIYMLLLGNSLISSRLSYALKALEIFIIVFMLRNVESINDICMIFITVLCTTIFAKNMTVVTSRYYSNINIWNMPYVTIFEDQNKIFKDYPGSAIYNYDLSD